MSSSGEHRFPGELFDVAGPYLCRTAVSVAMDEVEPLVGYRTCPPPCSEEGAGDRGDGVVKIVGTPE